MITPANNQENRSLSVKMSVSFLQWGERPGNLRFTLFTASPQLPIGCVSIGGMAAYKLQKMIQTSGHIEAKVVRGGALNQFILTELLGNDGFRPWKEVVFQPVLAKARELDEVPAVELGATRVAMTPPASNRVQVFAKL